jgi:hypothetical protein
MEPNCRAKIEGGYFLVAKKILESRVMQGPPLHAKLFLWMMSKACYKKRGKLKRGQLFTTIADMQEAMSYYAGFRKETPTRDQIRRSYEAHTEAHTISVAKTTRGMIITILNYSHYQNARNYETHTKKDTKPTTKVVRSPHYKERSKKGNIYTQQAEKIYATYPKKADRNNSIKSIIKLLKAGIHPETLLKAVVNYKAHIELKGIERDYIIQSNNFFGRAARWEEWKDGGPPEDKDPELEGPAYQPFKKDV